MFAGFKQKCKRWNTLQKCSARSSLQFKDIQGLVAGCVQGACVLQLQGVASLDSLPEEVQNKIENRNLKRANHAKDLRSALEDLLQATVQASQRVAPWEVTHAIQSKRDLVEAMKRISEQDRQAKHLEYVLAAACSSVQAYNIAHAASGAECDRMGAQLPSSMPEEGEAISSVLRMYDNWRESHLENKHAERSDAVVIALQDKFADAATVRKVLGVEKAEAQKDTGFEEALEAAGSAIAEERENQSKDALGFFPCTALLHAGRQLLETWKTESAAIRNAVQVCGMLEEDLKQHEQCLGLLSKNKETFVAELLAARALHDERVIVLETLTPVITKGNASMIRKVAQGFELQDVPADQLMSNLLNDVKEAPGGLTAAMMKLTGEIQQHFPEVILLVAKGLPPELVLLWRPTQSLESFDEKELVESETRHTFVWRVRDDETWFAIKEYPIRQASDLRTCFREAAMVYRHRHLNIVEIKAVFLVAGGTSTSFYMQMPWYKHGSVDNWVCGDQRPGWVKVRSVLLDALLGLAHLHENGILHCDVKPPNILVDDRERGRLADFDISIDTKERTLRGSMTTTICATALGMSSGFAAPELQSSRQATKHTDMFAYGKTMLCLQGHCEPGAVADHDKARGQTAALVSNLTSEDPQSRPAAKHAIVNDFFSILNDVRIRDSKVCLLCNVNGDDGKKDTDAGIECSEGHFHCGSCVVILVQDFLKVENKGKHAWMKGEVKCFKCPTECNAPGFKERDLVRLLSVDDFKAYLNGKLEILEADLKLQLEKESKKQVEEEVARLKALDERERRVLLARKHIEEEIMQLKCPRQSCRRAFFDFEGCFALSCSACKCKFCGWCLQDCGDHDAQPHVLQCAHVPRGVDAFFPQMPTVPLAFEKIHKERCRERTMSYINNEVETDIREQVRQQVQKYNITLKCDVEI